MKTKDFKLPKNILQTLLYLNTFSPYYKNLFKRKKIKISQIKTYYDFKNLPITFKKDITRQNSKFMSSYHSFTEWVTTSGTSTHPIAVPLTKDDLKRLELNEKLSLKGAGVTKKDRVLLAVAMDKLFIAGLAYYLGVKSIGAEVLRAGAASSDFVLNSLVRFKPSVLIGVPSFLIKIAKKAKDADIKLTKIGLKKIIAIGEPVAKIGFERNNLGKTLQNLTGVKVLSTYASTEMSTSFCECSHQKGGHYLNNLVFLEVLDGDYNPVRPGETGEVIVTPIGIQGFPILRYATGDIARFYPEKCACGYKHGRISPILGRKSGMLKIKGTTVFLSSIFDALASISPIKNYFVTLKKNEELSDSITIDISVKKNEIKFQNHIREKLKGILKITPEIKIISDKLILKKQMNAGTKKKVFKDLR